MNLFHSSWDGSVQSLNHVWLFITPWTIACQASLPVINSQSLLKFMSIESVMPSNYLILSFPSPSAFNLSQHQGPLQWVSSHQVAKALEFSFSINPSDEYSGLISFRIDWLALLAVQGTLKSLIQHHNLKASILRCSYAHILLGYTYLGLLCLSRSYLSKVAVPISILISPVWTLLLFCNLVIALTC